MRQKPISWLALGNNFSGIIMLNFNLIIHHKPQPKFLLKNEVKTENWVVMDNLKVDSGG